MDTKYQHGTDIYVVRACADASDLLAIGGDHSVDILTSTSSGCHIQASFHVGSRITAIAWSSKSTSPSYAEEWYFELAVAGADFGLHLLTKSNKDSENIFTFGGGLSGHHGKVQDMTFCGGRGEDSARYVATVSDDKMLMVWDLYPTLDISSGLASPDAASSRLRSVGSPARPQPTAYVIAFPYPLTSINSHPTTSKEYIVSDCRGSVFLIDWRSDPEEMERDNWRHLSLVELVEPRALSKSSAGLSTHWAGCAAWHRETTEIVAAVYGSRFCIWDISKLRGGKPSATGTTFTEGAHRIRWCETYPEYFAISTLSVSKGAVIHVHNYNFIHAQPTVFSFAPRPDFVRDFDFLSTPGIPRLAAAVGHELFVCPIGTDS